MRFRGLPELSPANGAPPPQPPQRQQQQPQPACLAQDPVALMPNIPSPGGADTPSAVTGLRQLGDSPGSMDMARSSMRNPAAWRRPIRGVLSRIALELRPQRLRWLPMIRLYEAVDQEVRASMPRPYIIAL